MSKRKSLYITGTLFLLVFVGHFYFVITSPSATTLQLLMMVFFLVIAAIQFIRAERLKS